MILLGIGVGPGDPEMVTLGATEAINGADAVFLPVSGKGRASVAGGVYESISAGNPRKTHRFWFPMTVDADARDAEIVRRLEELRPVWEGAETVAVPVIGDSALYSTTAYLYAAWRTLCPELELRLIPGISAHSLASSIAGEFMALGEERLAILPGSCQRDLLAETLAACDCAALYKPSALGDGLPELIRETGPWRRVLRVHRAGLDEQLMLSGEEAVSPTDDYLSVILLWRNR